MPHPPRPSKLSSLSGGDHEGQEEQSQLALGTLSIHADDHWALTTDVSPPVHVSTTYRYPEKPEDLRTAAEISAAGDGDGEGEEPWYVYSRHTSPTHSRLESLLSAILSSSDASNPTNANPNPTHPVLVYSSGQAAFHAALAYFAPRRLSIGKSYHGCIALSQLFSSLTGMQILPLTCPPEDLHPGDLIHIETPTNPAGEAVNIKHYAEKAHARGAYLLVDSTFGPPPLQDPFLWGADMVMHSVTKYIGGHSDMLGGLLAVRSDYGGAEAGGEKVASKMKLQRLLFGSTMGGLESWLGLRSIRTLSLRVERASYNATKLVEWLYTSTKSNENDASHESKVIRKTILKIHHASIQVLEDKANAGKGSMSWVKEQMPRGYGPVFSIVTRTPEQARNLPSKLCLFHHATSLGGVESLIEWRAMSDASADRRFLRVSVGVEAWEDLKNDLMRGFLGVADLGGEGEAENPKK